MRPFDPAPSAPPLSAPIPAPAPPPATAPITAPRAAPPPVFAAVFPPRPCCLVRNRLCDARDILTGVTIRETKAHQLQRKLGCSAEVARCFGVDQSSGDVRSGWNETEAVEYDGTRGCIVERIAPVWRRENMGELI